LQVVPGALRGDQSITYWARAIGSARGGNLAEAHKDLDQIETIRKEFVAQKKTNEAESIGEDYQEAAAWVAHSEGKDDEAFASLRALADKADKLGEEPEGIPAREQLADMLLEAKHPQQALAEYQTDLKLNPNRFNGVYGAARAAEAAGKQTDASEYYALLLKVCDGSSSTRPELSRARQLVAQK
jgi:predicted Zn-dependent protease